MNGTESAWDKNLKPFFEKCKAADVSPAEIRRYMRHRKEQKNRFSEVPSSRTINREFSILRAASRSPKKEERLRHVPHFPTLSEENVREGFLRDEDYRKLADGTAKVGLWLRTLLAVCHNFRWRRPEAAQHLKLGQVGLAGRTICSRGGAQKTKNRSGRECHRKFSDCCRLVWKGRARGWRHHPQTWIARGRFPQGMANTPYQRRLRQDAVPRLW